MELSDPIVFEPLFMERVWGGRRLETLLGKRLPQTGRIGESWEVVDRAEAQSVVHDGVFRGATLHELWSEKREEVFGTGLPDSHRFPLLCKILDAQERLSVQVHPPAEVAARFGGEPKTEMWYVMDAMLDSDLYVGLKAGVTRESFEQSLLDGKVAEQVHKVPVKTGDAIFIPSGRLHAIGAGNLIVEVQQNSDTTYRVFDWNRIGFDGRPRELHVQESLASINFTDIEPAVVQAPEEETLVRSEFFNVARWELSSPRDAGVAERFAIFTVIEGHIHCGPKEFGPGSFFVVPKGAACDALTPVGGRAVVLRTAIA